MKARYDLRRRLVSHDFFHWLVVAKSKGATAVVFDNADQPKLKHAPLEVARRFIETALMPGCAMAGLPYHFGKSGDDIASHHLNDFVSFIRGGGQWERLKNPLPPNHKARYTVTLRHFYLEQRNSDEAAWRKFAEAIGAHVIPDYHDAPMSMYEKQAIYDGAWMNFGVNNGPMHLASLTTAPVTIFLPFRNRGYLHKNGVAVGEAAPWMGANQQLVWAQDSYDNLMWWFEQWQHSVTL